MCLCVNKKENRSLDFPTTSQLLKKKKKVVVEVDGKEREGKKERNQVFKQKETANLKCLSENINYR